MASSRAARPAHRDDLVSRTWALFASPRLLAALAAAAVLVVGLAGPLRRAAAAFEAGTDGGLAWSVFSALELQDPLHAWPYTILLILAALAAAACAVDRLPRAVRAALHPVTRLTDEAARGVRAVVRTESATDPEAMSARVAAAFRARGYAPHVEKEGRAVYVFAERGRASRFGAPLAALGLLVLLLGAIARSLFGWEGTVEVPEGGFVTALPARTPTGDPYRRALPFVARLDALDVRAGTAAPPVATRAVVTLYDPAGQPLPGHREEDVAARAASDRGVAVSLVGARELPAAARATLAITDKNSGIRRELLAARNEPVDVGGGVSFTVLASTDRYGQLGPAVQLRRGEAGRATEFWVFENRPEFDGQNRPDRFAVEFHGMKPGHAAVLSVAHEPGTLLVVAGAAVLLAGAALALHRVHRRLWVRVEPGSVVLAGSTPRSRGDLDRLLGELRDGLSGPGGARPDRGEATA